MPQVRSHFLPRAADAQREKDTKNIQRAVPPCPAFSFSFQLAAARQTQPAGRRCPQWGPFPPPEGAEGRRGMACVRRLRAETLSSTDGSSKNTPLSSAILTGKRGKLHIVPVLRVRPNPERTPGGRGGGTACSCAPARGAERWSARLRRRRSDRRRPWPSAHHRGPDPDTGPGSIRR